MKSLHLPAALACCAIAFAQQPPSELKYAVIVTRHGVRSPTWTPDRLNQYSSAAWPDFGVPPGNLTVHGRSLMKQMGGFYRDYFPALLGKPNCASRAYFWADTDQRTLETAHALAEGMLPGCKVDVHSVEGKSDPLFDPIEAGTVKPDATLALAAVTGRIGPKLDAVIDVNRPAFEELNRILNGSGKAATSIFAQPLSLTAGDGGASMSGPLNLASTLTENLLLEYADGMSGAKLGWGRLNAANLQQVMALHTAYADLMRRTPYLARARGGNLLARLTKSLEQAASGKAVEGALGSPGDTMLVISGHDTNVSNLSGLLGLSWVLPSYQQDDAPPGGALIFSLWRSAAGRFSIQVQFVAQTMDQMHDASPLSLAKPPAIANLFVPGCSAAADGYACDWEAFLRAVQ